MVVKKSAHWFHILFYYSVVAISNRVNNLGTSLWLEVCLTHLDCNIFTFFFFLKWGSCICPKASSCGRWDTLLAVLPNASSIRILPSAHLFRLSKFSVKLIFLKALFFSLVISLFMKNDCLLFDSSLGIFTHLSLEQGSHFLVSTWFAWHHCVIVNLWVSWKYFRGTLKEKQN